VPHLTIQVAATEPVARNTGSWDHGSTIARGLRDIERLDFVLADDERSWLGERIVASLDDTINADREATGLRPRRRSTVHLLRHLGPTTSSSTNPARRPHTDAGTADHVVTVRLAHVEGQAALAHTRRLGRVRGTQHRRTKAKCSGCSRASAD
jgi:hypothetical protein